MKFSLIDVVKTVIAQEVTQHDPIVGWLDASKNYLDISGLHSSASINLSSQISVKSNDSH